MASRVLSYVSKDTWIHRLSGVTKMVFFLLWSLTSMISYDTRVLAVMLIISFAVFKISKTEWKQVATVFKIILIFLVLNLIAIFVLSPHQGEHIYGSRHLLAHLWGNYDITSEQLFYELNVMLKYLTVIPAVFMFIVTTDPSEFAASLNKIGVSYYFSYSVAIALRYVPDVQDDYIKIKHAQEARGIEMSGKAGFFDRIKNTSAILFPLILTSMDRIDVVSNAMQLRGFGKHKKRTWYSAKKLAKNDYLVLGFTAAFCTAALILTFSNGGRFYNPFN